MLKSKVYKIYLQSCLLAYEDECACCKNIRCLRGQRFPVCLYNFEMDDKRKETGELCPAFDIDIPIFERVYTNKKGVKINET